MSWNLKEIYKALNKSYDTIKPIDLNSEKKNKNFNVNKVSISEIEDFISQYAETKPPGF